MTKSKSLSHRYGATVEKPSDARTEQVSNLACIR